MNRKLKIKYLYKIASNKPMTMRQKILAGLLGVGTLAGVSQVSGQEEVDSPVRITGPVSAEEFQELSYKDYKIQSGDNIMNIALKLFPGQADRAKKHILDINNLDEVDAKNLQIGQIIKIPASREEYVSHFDLEENHHMAASKSLKEFIKQKEKLHPVGKKVEKGSNIETVGYGHRLNTKSKDDEYRKIKKLLLQSGRKDGALSETDPIVQQWFNQDIKEAEDRVKAKALPSLTQAQFDALVSLSYNAGDIPDIKYDLLSGNIAAAADKIRNHPSAFDSDNPGLAIRRAEEADLFMSN